MNIKAEFFLPCFQFAKRLGYRGEFGVGEGLGMTVKPQNMGYRIIDV